MTFPSDPRGTPKSPADASAWMELDATLERPLPAEEAEREEPFAEGPRLDRRGFLTGVGLAASLAACERLPVKKALPYLVPPEEITPGIPVLYASTCTACPAACGLIATVRDGRPTKLEGNPDHPLSRGGLCALGQADVRALYDPTRLAGPTLGGRPSTWRELDEHVRAGLEEARGSRRPVWVVTPTLTSPTARRAVSDFLARFPGRHLEWDADPETATAWLEAWATLAGRPVLPYLEIERADVLVAFGADLLGTGWDPVTHTAAYAQRRRAVAEGRPFRHVQVEGSLSLTGAAADERWAATAGERRLLALHLLARVARGVGASSVLETLDDLQELPAFAERLDGLVRRLLDGRGRSLLVTGDDDPDEALALALANRLLGNEGRTLDLARPSLVRRGRDADIEAFADALRAGEPGAVVFLGVDVVDALPAVFAGGEALAAVPLTIATSDRPTATTRACEVVAAAHHGLESWGDFAPRDGVLTLAQPLVRPLFDTRPPFESLLVWAGAETTDWRLYLRERWRRDVLPTTDGAAFEATWSRAVSSGRATGEATAPETPGPAEIRAALDELGAARSRTTATGTDDSLEAELLGEVALRDGSRAHVPWLRELPDPLTRVVWTACVRIAPERARLSGVRDGDVVAVVAGEARVELPVRVLPGQHPRVLGLPAGYGRVDGDPDHPEWNASRLVRFEGGRVRRQGLAVTLEKTGRTAPLPLVQRQPLTEGRPIVHEVSRPDEPVHAGHHPAETSLWPERERPSPQWHMVLDLDACTGCSACVVACQAENNIAVVGPDEVRRNRGMHWLRIDRYFSGPPDEPTVLFEPMLCSQCDHAPCETVCPVAATVHSEDGLNQQVYNRCVGTRYCANNCPYKVRAFNWFDNEPQEPLERMVLNPDVVVRSRGVMEKCTFCVQRIQAARIAARAEGRAAVPEVKTACQQSCPARAIRFGDATDPEGEIARLRHLPRAFQVLAELGVQPSITYLARVRDRGNAEEHA